MQGVTLYCYSGIFLLSSDVIYLLAARVHAAVKSDKRVADSLI